MAALQDASELSKAHMARLRTERAIKELLRVSDEAAEAVTAMRGVIDPLREAANTLAHAVRRARDHAADMRKSIEETKP